MPIKLHVDWMLSLLLDMGLRNVDFKTKTPLICFLQVFATLYALFFFLISVVGNSTIVSSSTSTSSSALPAGLSVSNLDRSNLLSTDGIRMPDTSVAEMKHDIGSDDADARLQQDPLLGAGWLFDTELELAFVLCD